VSPTASDIWLSAQEIADAALPGMPSTKMGVSLLAGRAGWRAKARPRQGRGGGVEYPITVLSVEAQRVLIGVVEPVEARLGAVEAVLEWRSAGHSKAQAIREVARARGVVEASLFRWIGLIEGTPREGWADLLSLPLREAEARAAILRAVDGLIASSGLSRVAALTVFVEAWNAGEDDFGLGAEMRGLLPRLSARSLIRWKSDFAKGGLAALAPRHGKHRKGQNKIEASDPVRTLIEAMLVQHPDSSAKLAMRALRARFADEKIPSYRTVQRWMEDWRRRNAALYEMARSPDGFRSSISAGKWTARPMT